MDRLDRLFDWLAVGLAAICCTILVLLLAANALEIVSRTFFSVSYGWIHETNLLLASWLYFLGIYVVYHGSGDVALSAIVTRLPATIRRVYVRLIELVVGVVFLVVAWYSVRLIQLQWPFHTAGIGLPNASFTAPLTIGLVATAVLVVRRALLPGRSTAGSSTP